MGDRHPRVPDDLAESLDRRRHRRELDHKRAKETSMDRAFSTPMTGAAEKRGSVIESPMHSIRDAALKCIVGALEKSQHEAGVVFDRAPASARTRLSGSTIPFGSSVPSGVRMEAVTDAAVLELEGALTQGVAVGQEPTGATFDLVVDGVRRDPVRIRQQTVREINVLTGEIRPYPAEPATVRFDLGETTGERRIEVWLPNSSSLTLIDVRVPEGTSFRPAAPSGRVWLHHGSSISQCSEAERPTETWPALVARATGRSLLNLALAGESHLDQFMARTIRDLPVDEISLELGINLVNGDTMRERAFVSAFHGFLDTIRDGHPTTPILVISPILCPVAEEHPGPTRYREELVIETIPRPPKLAEGALTLTRIRQLLNEHVAMRCSEGDGNLQLLDGLRLLGSKDADLLPDGLHPNPDGYRLMANRFLDQ